MVIFDVANADDNDDVGWVIDTLDVALQPLASDTVTRYVPCDKLVAVAEVCPLLHKYEYGVVPPDTVNDAEPVELP